MPRPTRRPGGRLNLPATLRANLAHARRTDDGRILVVPERPVFTTRTRAEVDWRLIFVVDVSGSMEASVVWSALTAAVLGGVPTLSTHFLAFSTQVIDLTDQVGDPLSLLLDVRVGGGTHIAAGLAHARSLVTVPSRTLVVVVSDFEEGHPLGGLLGEVRSLVSSGVHLLGCAALDDTGAPRYSVSVARQLVAARHARRRAQPARPRPLGGRPPSRRNPLTLPAPGSPAVRLPPVEPHVAAAAVEDLSPVAQEARRGDRALRRASGHLRRANRLRRLG
ncbi:VWA domain-containing protein [Streptosporangium lutulentum]